MSRSMDYTRRQFFSGFARALVPVPAEGEERTSSTSPAREWVRPPGALPEDAFLATCVRCTDCIEACPYQAIRRLGPEHGDAAATPAIIPHDNPCYLCADMPCITACAPRALEPTDRTEVRMGTAHLNIDACYVALGQPCDYCVTRCPLKGTAIAWDDHGLPSIHAEACTGCGVCAYLCPAAAIAIRP